MSEPLPIDHYASLLRAWLKTQDARSRESLLLEVDHIARLLLVGQVTQDELISLHHQAKLKVLASLPDRHCADLNPEQAHATLLQLASGDDLTPMLTLLLPMQLETMRRLEKAEETLRFKDMQRISTLAAGVAHDFNNLLGAIMGQVELCRQGHATDPLLSQHLDTIMQATRRGTRLVDDLYHFAQSLPLTLMEMDLGTWLEGCRALLTSSLPPEVTLQLNCLDRCRVQAAPFKLEQVLLNLVKNAGYAMRTHGGQVSVVLSRESDPQGRDMACLKVIDRGEGIAADALPHIFTPFFTTKPIGQGTGLGLAAAHGIIQQHGGSLSVSSTPGVMTEFRVLLPRLSEPCAQTESPPPRPPEQG